AIRQRDDLALAQALVGDAQAGLAGRTHAQGAVLDEEVDVAAGDFLADRLVETAGGVTPQQAHLVDAAAPFDARPAEREHAVRREDRAAGAGFVGGKALPLEAHGAIDTAFRRAAQAVVALEPVRARECERGRTRGGVSFGAACVAVDADRSV